MQLATCVFAAFMMLVSGVSARADEPIEVATIIDDPDVYHLRMVTLQGIVGRMRVLEPYFLPSGTACYGAYTFTLEDSGGSGAFIDVAVLGVCGRPIVLYPEIADGDKIALQAEIQMPGRFGQSRSLFGRPPANGDQPAVQAIAKTINRLGE